MRLVSETVKPTPPDDPRKDRWTAHRERRRREFVDAALRVLEADGPGLLMDSVAAEAASPSRSCTGTSATKRR